MKTNNPNDAVARGAAEWKENQNRQQVEKENRERLENAMRSVESICCYYTKESDGEMLYEKLVEHIPTTEEVLCVMELGSTEDIVRMIRLFGTADHSGYHASYGQKPVIRAYPLPPEVEEMIASRNNFSELNEFTLYQGFGARGQDILLARGNHSELLWYLKRHGLLLEQQRKLIARGDVDEIRTHIKHHGLAPELLDELLNELASGKTDNFYKFTALHEIPVSHQKRLLEVAAEPEFTAYINRYGFWEQVLPDLAALRSEDEIAAYIRKHHYLGKGIYELVKRNNRSLNTLYLQQPPCDNAMFIDALTKAPLLDYESLSKLYAQISHPGYFNKKEEKAVNLFQTGSHTDVMAYLKQEKPSLGLYAEAALFFRNKPVEYELYLDIKRYHELEKKINERPS